MTQETREFWNDTWATMDESLLEPDNLLITQVEGLSPGRALEIGCGTGGNAVWLAEHGWEVTAIDFSDVAIKKARQLAKERGVGVNFEVADASTDLPEGQYDLITSFYIQVTPEQRKKMLATAGAALAPKGTLLFVGHDKSDPPSDWSDEDLQTLTTPGEVAAEIPGLKIEQAYVMKHEGGAHTAHAHGPDEDHESYRHLEDDAHHAHGSSSTFVRAMRPTQ